MTECDAVLSRESANLAEKNTMVAHMRKDQVYLTTTLHNHKQYQATVCGKALAHLQRVVVQQQQRVVVAHQTWETANKNENNKNNKKNNKKEKKHTQTDSFMVKLLRRKLQEARVDATAGTEAYTSARLQCTHATARVALHQKALGVVVKEVALYDAQVTRETKVGAGHNRTCLAKRATWGKRERVSNALFEGYVKS
jgi:hypothetical protein